MTLFKGFDPKRLETKDADGGGSTPTQTVEQKAAEEALKAVHEAEKRLKEKEAKGEAGLSDYIEKSNKALEVLLKHEDENAKMREAKAAAEAKMADMEEKHKDMEIKLAKLSAIDSGDIERKAKYRQELNQLEVFCKEAPAVLFSGEQSKVERKYIRTDSNIAGGFNFTNTYDDMVIKKLTEISPLRQLARVKQVSGPGLDMLSRETLTTSYWKGEGDDSTESNSTYARPNIAAHQLRTKTKATLEALSGGEFDMESEIFGDMRESRLQKEGAAFVTGTGSGANQPVGFVAGEKLSATTSSSSGAVSYGDTITMMGQLKSAYDVRYGFNRKTLAYLLKLENGAGNPIWTPGNTAAGIDSLLNGIPYIEIPDMADIAASAQPIVLADFRRMYTIVDSRQAYMLRNPYKTDGYV